MDDPLLLGLWRTLVPIPRQIWQAQVRRQTAGGSGPAFMTRDHHRVRDLAVLDLPRIGRPLPPEHFAQRLDLPVEQVISILDDLEAGLTFLFRGDGVSVTWAYPVTVDPTPHHITFSTGEAIHAA